MLKPLEGQGKMDVWDDSQIMPGQKWRDQIQIAIDSTSVAVLLVSENFLASDFATENELPNILSAAEKQGLTVLWVPVRNCLWAHTPIANFQPAWSPARPLATLRGAKLNEALATIANRIAQAAKPKDAQADRSSA
jgi:hypothetical protein